MALILLGTVLVSPVRGEMRVSPPEISTANIQIGEENEIALLSVTNTGEKTRNYTVSVHKALSYREGYGEFPNNEWITFDKGKITIPAGETERIKVYLKIPREERWLGQHWEPWIQVTGERGAGETVALEVFVRVLISTAGTAPLPPKLIDFKKAIGIVTAALVICGIVVVYLLRLRRKS